jgi:hypothetical protein
MNINLKQIPILWYGGIKKGRTEKFNNVMNMLNLNTTFIEPYISNDPVNAVRIGCGKSHIKALRYSLKLNQPTLLLEDDINFTEYYKEQFEIPDDADAVYLGTCLNGLHPNWKNRDANSACCSDPILLNKLQEYYKITGMLTTHAILYVSENYKKNCIELIENDNGNNHCDVLIASNMHKYNVYACKYPMFFQDCLQDNKDAYEKTITPLFTLFK